MRFATNAPATDSPTCLQLDTAYTYTRRPGQRASHKKNDAFECESLDKLKWREAQMCGKNRHKCRPHTATHTLTRHINRAQKEPEKKLRNSEIGLMGVTISN